MTPATVVAIVIVIVVLVVTIDGALLTIVATFLLDEPALTSRAVSQT